jgi:2-polyprenyl-3-methyl-5-hydroxy-6-metoxy-1,4-benzoquinol methylase
MDKERVKTFAGEVFSHMAGAMTAGLGFIGVRTGLFKAMAGKDWMTLEEIVEQSNLQRRYVEEWLKGMVSAGYLEYAPADGTYRLPEEHAYLLASEGTDHFMGGLLCFAPVLLRVAPKVADAFEQGGGVPFEDFGSDGVQALDMINRGQYEQRLSPTSWLKSLPDVVERLEAGGRVLDVGCGAGRIALTLARTFPQATVVGLDPDEESIRQARAAAESLALGERVQFVARRTSDLEPHERFDFITACDCVHDFADPLQTLKEIRALLDAEGVLFVVEPRAADRLEDNCNPIATMYYGFSVFHCMTQSLASGGPGLGTCMGPTRTEALMREAGFTGFEMLDIRSQVLSFYAVRP